MKTKFEIQFRAENGYSITNLVYARCVATSKSVGCYNGENRTLSISKTWAVLPSKANTMQERYIYEHIDKSGTCFNLTFRDKVVKFNEQNCYQVVKI